MFRMISAIICAAGKGERAGFNMNKLLVPLFGEPALLHTLRKFNIPEIHEVIVTASESDFEFITKLCQPFKNYKVVLGGETRFESVKKALEHVSHDIVLIHDGARPYVSRKVILNCIASIGRYGIGITATRCVDTALYSSGRNLKHLLRDQLYLVQTPQGFYTKDIKKAYTLASEKLATHSNKKYTDDSSIYHEFCGRLYFCEGDPENKKLTYRDDFLVGMSQISIQEGARVGFGVDVHVFGPGDHVMLCGENIPCDQTLISHSDGDVATHALMDALLSATGLKDIGYYFPDTSDAYAKASSLNMLEEVVGFFSKMDMKPQNISISIQAEKPKIADYVDKMKINLEKVTHVHRNNISISAGTCEGLGFVGEGLGVVAYAFVSLVKIKNYII